jgi:hypothetical protein
MAWPEFSRASRRIAIRQLYSHDYGESLMNVHELARQDVQRGLTAAQLTGHDESLYLRALLSAVVERSKQGRGAGDLAQELMFLANNLDDDNDYTFMRP